MFHGIEFDPGYNRLALDLSFLSGESKITQKPVDPEDPYQAPHRGLFYKTIKAEGVNRRYAVYIPDRFPPFGDGILLFAPGGENTESFIEKSGIREIAEKKTLMFLVLESAEKSWREWKEEEILAYGRTVYRDINRRELCSWNESACYAVGLKDGAYAGNVFISLYSSVFAGCVLAGNSAVSEEFRKAAGNLPSDGDPHVQKRQVPISVWIMGDDEETCRYFRQADRVSAEYAVRDEIRMFQPEPDPVISLVDEQSVAEVWVSSPETAAAWRKERFWEEATSFLLRCKRWAGTGNRKLRRASSLDQIGLKKMELTVEGKKRFWYIYEPSAYRQNPEQKLPLVIGLHGICTSGEFFAQNSEWHRVAEARGFFMVYPNGYMHLYGECMCATRAWAGAGMEMPDDWDDIPFFKAMIETLCHKYPVDRSRIYAAGHSNGSAMVQMLIQKMPSTFAAYGPNGFAEGDTGPGAGPLKPYEHHIVCPAWLFKGEKDIGCGASLEAGCPNEQVLRRLCRLNGADYEKPKIYKNGIYTNYVWYDREHTPVVRFSALRGFPHAYTPENAWMTWDEYFCHFRRNEDGSSEYLG